MRRLLLSGFIFFSFHSQAQTLFTYGNDSVNVRDFLHAYTKNSTTKTEQNLKEYLNLYIASRLKIKEALVRRYDTLPQLVADIENLRSQILPNYERDNEAMDKLVDEAISRSQKDIHLAHIFIGYKDLAGRLDSAKAKEKATAAYKLLEGNRPFREVVAIYSDDTASKSKGGDIGYITAFTLPYELENLAYSTPVNKISRIYQSKAGYHIFKNLGERKALGRIKAAQILLAFPPDIAPAQKAVLKKLADSIYSRLLKGDDFAGLAAKFSNDYVSAQTNGIIPEFGVGQYSTEFENTILSLKDGGISRPFETPYGYHIVKRIKLTPVSLSKSDAKTREAMKEKIEQDDRVNVARDVLIKKVTQQVHYQPLSFNDKQLWALSDSIFSNLTPNPPTQLTTATPLFKLGNETTSAADWISYAQVSRYKTDGTGFKPYPQVWNEFVNTIALEYYKNHLEDFNSSFHDQMTEFKEGNLFFEIMQKEIWGPAQTDTLALEAYYKKNKSQYNWNKSADAVIFYTSDLTVAQLLAAQLKKAPSSWQNLVTSMSDKVSADSGRVELSQIPNASKGAIVKGMITSPVLNKADNTASFALINKIYTQPEPRSFEEAKGLVVNDYQAELEKAWIAELKQKYPVVVNQTVLDALLNTAKK